jgi:hypothetical protein
MIKRLLVVFPVLSLFFLASAAAAQSGQSPESSSRSEQTVDFSKKLDKVYAAINARK